MSNLYFIGHRALHSDFDRKGTILDVHLDKQPQTAKFLPDGWDPARATWVNLASLKLIPKDAEEEPDIL